MPNFFSDVDLVFFFGGGGGAAACFFFWVWDACESYSYSLLFLECGRVSLGKG